MPRRKSMIEIIDIIKRLRLNHSIRAIHRETGIHRKIIKNIKEKANQEGLLDTNKSIPKEEELLKIFKSPTTTKKHILTPYQEEIKGYIDKNYTYVVIYELLKDRVKVSSSTIRRYILKEFPKLPKPSMIRDKEIGTMEVDFGYLGIMYDPLSNKNRKTYVFSARLCKSRKAYREIVYSQNNETFLNCHTHAFNFFGGVHKKVVPDNTKAAVIKAAFYEPVINRYYHEFANHYGFLISPCLPRKPEHKGGVENDIKYIKRNFLPIFKEKERHKGFEIPRTTNLQEELDKWTNCTTELRSIGGVGLTVVELFEEEKKDLLLLPQKEWDRVVWKKCHVHKAWLVHFENAYYSVPYKMIGKTVDVCGNSKLVRIFYENELIAIHSKATKKWEYVRLDCHAPPFQEAYLQSNKKYILANASLIGSETVKVVERIFDKKGIDGTRSCRGILSFAKKYSKERLEKACQRALYYDTVSYISIKNILEKNMDSLIEEEVENNNEKQLVFTFARGMEYYQKIIDGVIT